MSSSWVKFFCLSHRTTYKKKRCSVSHRLKFIVTIKFIIIIGITWSNFRSRWLANSCYHNYSQIPKIFSFPVSSTTFVPNRAISQEISKCTAHCHYLPRSIASRIHRPNQSTLVSFEPWLHDLVVSDWML